MPGIIFSADSNCVSKFSAEKSIDITLLIGSLANWIASSCDIFFII